MTKASGACPDETFEALVFDWDGTAVPYRNANAAELRVLVQALCAAAVHVFVATGTHLENIDNQLGAAAWHSIRARPGRDHLQGATCCEGEGSATASVRAARGHRQHLKPSDA